MAIRRRILGLLLVTLPAAAHDDSVSFSRLDVGHDSLGVSLRLQALSVVEVLPWMDGNGDLLIDAAEAADRPEELGRYVLDHFRLYTEGAPLRPAEFPSIRVDPAALVPGSMLELRWAVQAPADGQELRLEVDLFRDTSPGHLEFTEVVWWGTEFPAAVLGQGSDSWSYRPPSRMAASREAARSSLVRSWSWSAALLAAALACATTHRRRTLLSALVAAGSGAAWLQLGAPAPPTQPIALAALLGGAYLASDLALFERSRAPWLEALGFGLLVGLAWGLEAPARLEAEVRPGLRAVVEVATVLAACTGAAVVLALLGNERRRRLAAAGVALTGLTTFVLVAFDV